MMDLKTTETWSSWSVGRLFYEVIKDRKTFIYWLKSRKLIPDKKYCNEGHEMKISYEKSTPSQRYRCRRKHIDGKDRIESVMKGTMFEHANCPEKSLMVCLLFANSYSLNEAFREVKFFGENVSKTTVSNQYNFCREMISRWMVENQSDEKEKIGGHDRTVVIELHRFQRPDILGSDSFENEEKWLIGIVERETNRYRVETFHGEKPNNETLYMFTVTYVLPQTIMICDSEAVRNSLENREDYYIYDIEEETIPPDGRTLLQYIESSWYQRKEKGVHPNHSEDNAFGERYLDYLFRRKMVWEEKEPFDKLIEIISLYYPIK